MARLTDRERNLIQEARSTPSWPTWDDTDAIILAARQARAETIARWIRQGLAPLAGAATTARSVIARATLPFRRDLLRRRTVNELYRLEDRVLADIGIARGQIEPIAANLALATLPPRKPRARLLNRLRSWRRCRAAVRELEALDDRLLDDIGLQRGNIREAVKQAATEALQATATSRNSKLALSAVWPSVAVRQATSLIGPIRRWLQRRATIRELEALDDRMLTDIGLLRRDIPTALDRQIARGRRAAAPTIEQANYWDSVVRMLYNWETSRETARKSLVSDPEVAANLDSEAKKFNRRDSAAAGDRAQRHKAA